MEGDGMRKSGQRDTLLPAVKNEEGSRVPRNVGSPQNPERTREVIHPWTLQKERCLAGTLTLGWQDPCQAAGLQNCVLIHLCSFKPLSCQSLVAAEKRN